MFNSTKTLLILIAVTSGLSTSANAQHIGGTHRKHTGNFDNHYNGYGHHYDNGHRNYRHPVTFGYRGHYGYRGFNWGFNWGFNGHEVADIVRSRAAANLVNAQARTQNEVARSARMDNRVKALHTYIARRSINSELRFGHLRARGDAIRATKVDATLVAHQAGIRLSDDPRLSDEEVNQVTGRLHWPLLLQMEHFNKARKPVNEIFASRARVGQVNPDHYLPLCDWIEKVSNELTKNVDNYPEADYAEAQDFLRRLLVEVRLPSAPIATMQFAAK
jgi:hypothetical protein